MLNGKSITERLEHLRTRVRALKRFQALSLEAYLADFTSQSAVERHFQVAIECCTDIAAHTVAIKGLKRPNKRRDVFLSLAEGGYLESDYAAVMSDMVGLRNRLVHLYMVIEPKKMYQYLQEDIVHFETFEAFAVALLEQEISRKD